MKRLLLYFLTLATIVACSKSETDDNGSDNGGGNITITIEKTSVSFDENTDEEKITFSATADWTAEIINDRADSWLSVSPKSGTAGDASITIKANDNDTPDERDATVLIKAGSASKTINVSQKQKDALTVTSSKFEVGSEGGEVKIEVKANIDFEYAIDPKAEEWILYEGTRAMKTSTLTFSVAENDDTEKREGKITIKSDEFNEVVTIYQAGSEPSIIISKNEYVVSSNGETISVEVASNVDVAVKMPTDVDWISENTTRATSTNTYRFDIQPNESEEQRSAEIKFTNKENNLSEKVKVIQTSKGILVVAKNEYEIGAYGGHLDFAIKTNFNITVTISNSAKEWITPVNSRALETKQLYFNIKACNNESGREGTITLSGNDLEQVIKVRQLGPQETYNKEREALIALYNATGGDNWNYNENWCSDKPVSEWDGVECNVSGYVIELQLASNNLVGAIPAEIGALTGMKRFSFKNNSITSIPPEIDNMTELFSFNLSNNPITSLPDEVSNLINLETVEISNTNISLLPDGFANLTNIHSVYANNCKIESFPEVLCHMPNLIYIDLKNNQMSGEIPEEIGNLVNLAYLDISYNNLSGPLPDGMGNLASLTTLYAQRNQITGTVPSTFCNLSKINIINLGYNKMSGTIPQEIVKSDWWAILWREVQEGNLFTEEELIIPAPKFSVTDNYGNVVDNSIFAKHKYTVLFQINTSNPNSTNQLPSMKWAYTPFKDGIGFYCYSREDDAATLNSFAASHDYPWPMFCTPEGGGDRRKVPFFSYRWSPSINIFDRNGMLVYNAYYHGNYYEKELETFLTNAFHFDASYESTDFSKDGEVVTLQTATEGKGIDIVLMGDGYSDRLIEDGTYDEVMNTAMEKFFDVEPYKSFRHLFNVYSVKAVSKNEISVADLETAFSGQYWLGSLIGDNPTVKKYAIKAVGEERIDETSIAVILHNNNISGGICYWDTADYLNDYGSGTSISYLPYAFNKTNLGVLIQHETGGHGFAKLADEYIREENGRISESDVESLKKSQIERGWHKNIDFTDNLSTIRWAKFISDSRYANESIGAYEGAYLYPYGVWRPTEKSIMTGNIGQYNAPSREAIYYRIHKLAYGEDWEYDYEEFVEWDAKNRNVTTTSSANHKPINHETTHLPVIINNSWRK